MRSVTPNIRTTLSRASPSPKAMMARMREFSLAERAAFAPASSSSREAFSKLGSTDRGVTLKVNHSANQLATQIDIYCDVFLEIALDKPTGFRHGFVRGSPSDTTQRRKLLARRVGDGHEGRSQANGVRAHAGDPSAEIVDRSRKGKYYNLHDQEDSLREALQLRSGS